METWKEIKDYEGLYYVSDYGNVMRGGKKLKTHICNSGYCMVSLSKSGFVKVVMVHRIVANTFLGQDIKKQVNHKNGIKTDNRVENLEWCTPKENMAHARDVLRKTFPPPTMIGKFGKDHNRSIPFKVMFENGEIHEYGSGLEFRRKTGLDHSAISYASKKHLPYKFLRGCLKGKTLISHGKKQS